MNGCPILLDFRKRVVYSSLYTADGNGDFTKDVDLEVDRTVASMGIRSQHYAMIVNDGVVELLNVEAPMQFEVSDVDTILNSL